MEKLLHMTVRVIGCLLFQSMSSEDYRKVMRVVEKAILSTDMAMYFKKKNNFLQLSDEGEFDWQSPEKKDCELLRHSLARYSVDQGRFPQSAIRGRFPHSHLLFVKSLPKLFKM